VAGVVAIAAVVSGVRSGGGDDSPAATDATAATITATAEAIPVGDLRRLPPPQPGTYAGSLVAFDALTCQPEWIDLATVTRRASPARPACNVWSSPGGTAFARTGPPELEEVRVAATPDTAGTDAGITYPAGPTHGALAITDDGTVAVCDGTSIHLSRAGRVQTLPALVPVDTQFADRCIIGALGARVIHLADNGGSFVDLATGRSVRRLAKPASMPLAGLASSPDGLVIAIDVLDGAPEGVVYGVDGNVVVPSTPVGDRTGYRKVLLSPGGRAVAVLTARGWQITSLESGASITAPGGARIIDVAFSPDGRAFAATTEAGILFAAVGNLAPASLLPGTFRAVAWLRRVRGDVVTAAPPPAIPAWMPVR
jgi:hypothetical protein